MSACVIYCETTFEGKHVISGGFFSPIERERSKKMGEKTCPWNESTIHRMRLQDLDLVHRKSRSISLLTGLIVHTCSSDPSCFFSCFLHILRRRAYQPLGGCSLNWYTLWNGWEFLNSSTPGSPHSSKRKYRSFSFTQYVLEIHVKPTKIFLNFILFPCTKISSSIRLEGRWNHGNQLIFWSNDAAVIF